MHLSKQTFLYPEELSPFLVHDPIFLTLSRLHDPILEENLFKEPEEGNLQESLKSLHEGSSKGPHGLQGNLQGGLKSLEEESSKAQLLSLLSSFTILQQKLRSSRQNEWFSALQWGNPRNMN